MFTAPDPLAIKRNKHWTRKYKNFLYKYLHFPRHCTERGAKEYLPFFNNSNLCFFQSLWTNELKSIIWRGHFQHTVNVSVLWKTCVPFLKCIL